VLLPSFWDSTSSRDTQHQNMCIMSRGSLMLLVLATATAVASGVQTGIFYWCSLSERGTNIPIGPRSTTTGGSNSACAVAGRHGTNSPLAPYTNFTAFPSSPNNDGSSQFDISPTGCLVRLRS
jgi:hypothetical protein